VGKTAKYVLNLIDVILGAGEREKCFEWAQGDPSPLTKRTKRLPFDSVWEARKLIIEIDEDQHAQATPFFDKPHKITVSGVHRGEQRAIYDRRKRAAAKKNGYKVVAIPWPTKKKQRPSEDTDELRQLLHEAGVVLHDAAEAVKRWRRGQELAAERSEQERTARSRTELGPKTAIAKSTARHRRR
jgi:hypothetical protein